MKSDNVTLPNFKNPSLDTTLHQFYHFLAITTYFTQICHFFSSKCPIVKEFRPQILVFLVFSISLKVSASSWLCCFKNACLHE